MSSVQSVTARLPARSMGLKLLLVCALALVMTIPALFVFALIRDRDVRAGQVVTELSRLIGGPQTFVGPVLSVPYSRPKTALNEAESGAYVIFPETGRASAAVKTSVRQRGLFKAPVWTADIALQSAFDLTTAGALAPSGAVLDWSRAELVVGASDMRGAKSDVVLAAGGCTVSMTPALTQTSAPIVPPVANVGEARRILESTGDFGVKLLGAPASGLAQPGARFEARVTARFSGAQRLALLPYAKTTVFDASGDWPDPSYAGVLPESHDGLDGGTAPSGERAFKARWSLPYVAREVPGEGPANLLSALGGKAMAVTFVEVANPYQAVSRSLKYAPMFLGLVFLAYFLFETVQKKRIHPAQYILIGLAQVIFYLLLLSIAERIGFDWGFVVAAVATVTLISAYAGWVFGSRRQGLVALAAFSALYGLIYILMRLQDWALLVGAVTSFAAIAAVMYFTRNIDWYGQAEGPSAEDKA